jgi:hypothetical protein
MALGGVHMSLPVTSVMLIFWLFMAYRAFQRAIFQWQRS